MCTLYLTLPGGHPVGYSVDKPVRTPLKGTLMSDTTPAGWYPHPGAEPGVEMYWDGAQWRTEMTRPVAGVGENTVAVPEPVPAVAADVAPAKRPWYKRKAIVIPAAVVAALIVIPAVASGLAPDEPTGRPPVSQGQQEQEPVDTTVEIPDMVGGTVAEAKTALTAVGITLDLPADVADDWIVTSQTVPGGDRIEPGDPLSISAEAPKPKLTLAQENVIRQAQSYLRSSGFSRAGLIGQLEYEGYSTADATFGADNAGADWNAEAAEKAESYLNSSSFSRQGLYDQLAYEEFTPEQIEHALAAVGY